MTEWEKDLYDRITDYGIAQDFDVDDAYNLVRFIVEKEIKQFATEIDWRCYDINDIQLSVKQLLKERGIG
jgi:hypothetical protein